MKLPHRRQFLHLAAGAAALPAVSPFAWAQAYPPWDLLVCNAGTEFRFVGYPTQVPKYFTQAGADRPFGDHPVSLLKCELITA
jgi:hypothetical protein